MTEPGVVLLTGFAPFDGATVNPTELLMRRLAGEPGVATAVLPVGYVAATERFIALVEEHRPAAAVC
ncbi:pyrrolidone-carboxylate peptidase, partial [bacterium]|nr:pyrrolidone-carboxylate peptidase [bacterium]